MHEHEVNRYLGIPTMMKRMIVCLLAAMAASPCLAAETRIKRDKLQIVLLLGQSNMVGLGSVRTAWYLTQPQWVPPREAALRRSRYFDWGNFYWSGLRYYVGPRKAELDRLLGERRESRWKWRRRIHGREGIKWDEASWGKHPGYGRSNVYPFLDKKAEEEGIYKRMAEILDSDENQLTADVAYEQMTRRDGKIAEERRRVIEIYLKGTTGEDFDGFDAAVRAAEQGGTLVTGVGKNEPFPEAEKHRATYAELARKHVRLPIAKRTRIYAHGAVSGSGGQGIVSTTHGPLSVGYGAGITKIGPEYGVGITLERLVDAPILLVKCSWGNTSIADAWRAPSLDGVETPTEKAMREDANRAETEEAKREGRKAELRPAPKRTDKLSWCWEKVMPQIDRVLADPGRFHPEYDPQKGYEVAGLVWFQGYSDMGNPAYAELLIQLIKDLREKVKTPNMPVVCGSLGHAAYKQSALSSEANKGMLQASGAPELKGTVDVVNTAPFYPVEFDFFGQIRRSLDENSDEFKKLEALGDRAIGDGGSTHYHGSAKFFLLMGDAVARSLANLIAGGRPMIHDSPKQE